VAAGLMLVGAPAFAQPRVTETTVQKNLVETFEDVIPTCKDGGRSTPSRPPVIPSSTPTTFDDGRIHATFTRTDTFVAVPLEDPSLPSYTGKFTGRVQPERQDGEWHLHLHYTGPAPTGRRSRTTRPTTSSSGPTATVVASCR
jgi:hypothetical protein